MKILGAIFLLGFLLRFLFLDISPPGFNADEAALGYNAYSLLKTGNDEWGEKFPLVFKSFSDYKPGLYVYLAMPFVAVFGLNELAVRLPSILLGSLSIVMIYFLSKELFKRDWVALATALLLAISPWHIHFSRGAWETNIATFFMLLGVLAFIKSFRNRLYLWLAVIAFIASMYTYQSPRLVVPALAILLLPFFWRKLLIKQNVFLAVSGIILLIPLIFIITGTAGLARFQGLSIFSDKGPLNRVNQERGQHQDPSSLLVRLFHNKGEVYTGNFIKHYLDHFDPNFLFTTGDSLKRNKVPDMGQMYFFEIATFLLGLFFLIKERFTYTKVVLVWLMVAPLASSLTYQTPNAIRAHNMIIPLTLISGLGLGILCEKLLKLRSFLKYSILGILSTVIFVSASYFLDRYFIHLPKQYALEWEYGFSQALEYVAKNQDQYQKIVITDKNDQPYILTLFYLKYDPALYQKQIKGTGDNKFGFSTVNSFGKYEFRPIGKEEFYKAKNTLFIATESEADKNIPPIKIINFPNGEVALKAIETK